MKFAFFSWSVLLKDLFLLCTITCIKPLREPYVSISESFFSSDVQGVSGITGRAWRKPVTCRLNDLHPYLHALLLVWRQGQGQRQGAFILQQQPAVHYD